MSLDTTLSAFWQTLSAEFSDASQVFTGTFNLTKSAYKDVQPVVASIGQTINVPIPADMIGSVQDGNGALTFNAPSFSYIPVAFNQNPVVPIKITDFEQFNSPQAVNKILVKPMISAIRTAVNNYLWTIAGNATDPFTTDGTNAATAIATTAHDITPTQFLGGLEQLAEAKIPVTDTERMSLVVHPKVYYGMLADTNWTEYMIAGATIAEKAHVSGEFATTYGVNIKMDQGATTTGTIPTRTFKGVLMHEYALCVASRPLPSADGNVVREATFLVDGLPVQVLLGYSLLNKGWLLTASVGYGAAVLRSQAGVEFSTTEA